MRLHIASDHAAFELKAVLARHLDAAGHEVTDHGPHEYDGDDHYPTYCIPAAQAVVDDPGSLGIVLGGSGNGEQMAANLVDGVRCALAWSIETARLTREHNDANVVSVGARMHPQEEAIAIVDEFLATSFSGEERHAERIRLMAQYEKDRPAR